MGLYFMPRKLIRTHAGAKPDSPNVLSLSHVAENQRIERNKVVYKV